MIHVFGHCHGCGRIGLTLKSDGTKTVYVCDRCCFENSGPHLVVEVKSKVGYKFLKCPDCEMERMA